MEDAAKMMAESEEELGTLSLSLSLSLAESEEEFGTHLVYHPFSYTSMRPSAPSECGVKLLAYEALSY
jgi:hypothetical protein